MEARKWLRKNDYNDIADMIDEIIEEWRIAGNGTRRNWWEVLAGWSNGKPSVIAGREFPVLRAAQIRQGKPVTPNAIYRIEEEAFPEVRRTGRWPKIDESFENHQDDISES